MRMAGFEGRALRAVACFIGVLSLKVLTHLSTVKDSRGSIIAFLGELACFYVLNKLYRLVFEKIAGKLFTFCDKINNTSAIKLELKT